ncbi:MAG: DUF6691 family protein [Pseudomonadota bacterium]
MKQNLSALLGGMIFGAGLVIAGMTNPEKVLAFLTLNQNWDPALILVMGSAVVVATIGFWAASGRDTPLFDTAFHLPGSTTIDSRLVAGAGLFGIGWGISGFCPGPAIVGLLSLDVRAVIFVIAYIAGVKLFEVWERNKSTPVMQGDG